MSSMVTETQRGVSCRCLRKRASGLWCAAGGFHIDPWEPVERAVITHAHGDHARPGQRGLPLCRAVGEALLRRRFGPDTRDRIDSVRRQSSTIGDVRVSFHPAGHVLGSAQIRIESADGVWVVAGDYKRAADPTCAPFEPVRATCSSPNRLSGCRSIAGIDTARRHRRHRRRGGSAIARPDGRSVLFCYTIGKAQRLLAELMRVTDRPVYVHGMMLGMIEVYREAGVAMLPVHPVIERARGARSSAASFAGELVLAPLSARGTPWMRRLGDISDAFASGLMRVRGVRRQRGFDRGFVLSDHADWPALLQTIAETGAGARARHPWLRRAARALSGPARAAGGRHPTRRGKANPPAIDAMKRFAALYDAIDRTTSTNAKVAAMVQYFQTAPADDAAWAVFFLTGRRLKRLVPSAAIRDVDARGHRSRRLAARRVLRGRRRRRRDRRARARSARGRDATDDAPLAAWVRGADSAAARARSGRPAGTRQRLVVARSIGCSASCCSRSSPASCASACRRRSSSARWRRPPVCRRPTIAARLMGDWAPAAEWFAAPPLARAHGRRPVAALSVLSGLAARGAGRSARRRRRLAGRVEMGRHPRAARAPRRCRPSLVARRRADHASLSRDRGRRHAAARRHGARRRGPRVPRRSAAALLRAAAAHRPPEAGRADGRARCRSCSWPTTSSSMTASTSAISRSTRAPRDSASRCSTATWRAAHVDHRRRAASLGRARRAAPELTRAAASKGLMLKRRVVAVRRRTPARRLVEVEDRPVHDRRGADLRAAGQRHAARAC